MEVGRLLTANPMENGISLVALDTCLQTQLEVKQLSES
jgi:hypothetical protein